MRQIDDEAGGEHLRGELAQELHRALGRAAGGDQIAHHDDPVALLDRVLVHRHLVQTAFQRVGDRHPLVRQLALLADGHEAGRDLVRHRSAQEKPRATVSAILSIFDRAQRRNEGAGVGPQTASTL